MITTKEDRRALKRRRQEHESGAKVSMLDCPRCPRVADIARKVTGTFPTWYPSSPPRVFLYCASCHLIWDTREDA